MKALTQVLKKLQVEIHTEENAGKLQMCLIPIITSEAFNSGNFFKKKFTYFFNFTVCCWEVWNIAKENFC